MISKLAKSAAHFFVVQNITEESKEVIYAYGMELLISDVLNTLIVLLIALIFHTLPAVVIFIAVFSACSKSSKRLYFVNSLMLFKYEVQGF